MGALAPILYQGAIPVFADVDPVTGNVTAESIEAALSDRTRAIVVTHLFGNPVRHGRRSRPLAASRGIPIIEDSRAGATGDRPRPQRRHDRRLSARSAFSRASTSPRGEGGFVLTDDDDSPAAVRIFVNKAWPYGEPDPDHQLHRAELPLTELQGAVAARAAAEAPGQRRASRGEMRRAARRRRWPSSRASRCRRSHADDDALVLEVLPVRRPRTWCRAAPSRSARALKDARHRVGAALRREAGIRAAGCSASSARSATALAVHRGAARGARLRRRAVPGHLRFLDTVLVLPWNERYEQRPCRLHRRLGDRGARRAAGGRRGVMTERPFRVALDRRRRHRRTHARCARPRRSRRAGRGRRRQSSKRPRRWPRAATCRVQQITEWLDAMRFDAASCAPRRPRTPRSPATCSTAGTTSCARSRSRSASTPPATRRASPTSGPDADDGVEVPLRRRRRQGTRR